MTEDLDPRVREIVEFFSVFEEKDILEPHHNVEIAELFEQTEVQEAGEITYYYGDLGSFWMQYSEEMYKNGYLVRGRVSLNPELSGFMREVDLLDPSKDQSRMDPSMEYLKPVDYVDNELCDLKELVVPKDYESAKLIACLNESMHIMNQFQQKVGEMTEDPYVFRPV